MGFLLEKVGCYLNAWFRLDEVACEVAGGVATVAPWSEDSIFWRLWWDRESEGPCNRLDEFVGCNRTSLSFQLTRFVSCEREDRF